VTKSEECVGVITMMLLMRSACSPPFCRSARNKSPGGFSRVGEIVETVRGTVAEAKIESELETVAAADAETGAKAVVNAEAEAKTTSTQMGPAELQTGHLAHGALTSARPAQHEHHPGPGVARVHHNCGCRGLALFVHIPGLR
jgi:hypothetical protein